MKKIFLATACLFMASFANATILTVMSSIDDGTTGSLTFEVGAAASGDTITFNGGLDTIFLNVGEVNITTNLTIIGNGSTILTSSGASRAFNVGTGNVKLIDLEIFDCVAVGNGGAIINTADLSLDNCNIHDCNASGQGGAIETTSNLTLNNCFILNNQANEAGGINCGFGAFNVDMDSTLIADNTASGSYAGGVNYLTGSGSAFFTYCIFDNNTSATSHGGGIDINGGAAITIDECEFMNNHADGDWGGALFLNTNATSVSVSNTRLHHNTAQDGPALGMNNATINFTNCVVDSNTASGSGGAFYIGAGSGNTLDATNTSFMGNSASIGGAIYTTASGNGTHTNCTYYQNDGGSGNGGAVYSQNYDWIYNSCTFSENMTTGSGGAIYCFGSTGSYMLNRCTMVNNNAGTNGGGLYTGSGGVVATFMSSIVAGNTCGGTGQDIRNTSGGIASSGFNFIGTEDNTLLAWQASDITGDDQNLGCAKLLPIQDNGGGILTHNLNSCSPCIGSGATGPATDQNGISYLGSPSIGSTEYAGFISPTNADVLNSLAVGPGSVHDLICNTCIDTLFFNVATNGVPIQPTSHYSIDRDLTIIGNGPGLTSFDGGATIERAFNIDFGLNVEFKALQIQDFDVTGASVEGGAIYNNGALLVNDVVFLNNWAREGGAIFSSLSSGLMVDNCTFIGDSASVQGGGAIRLVGNNLDVDSSSFQGCGTAGNGGAVYAFAAGGTANISYTTFDNNRSVLDGGALWIEQELGSSNFMNKNTYTDNHTTSGSSKGGAIYFTGRAEKILDSCLFNNNSAGTGSSIYIDSSFVTMSNSFFDNNDATNTGGDLFISSTVSDTSKIDNCAFVNDTTLSAGSGAIWIDSSNVNISRSTFSENVGLIGTAILQDAGGTVNLSYNTVINNWNASGGSVVCNGGTMNLIGNIIAQNIGTFADVSSAAGGMMSNGFNVIGDGGTTGAPVTWLASDTTGTLPFLIDPLVFPLAFNGAGWSPSFSLRCLSPALERGGSAPTFDQLGNPIVGSADAGAFEIQTPYVLPSAVISNNILGCGDGTYVDSVQINFTGTAPFSMQYADGTDTLEISGINSGAYFLHPDHSGTYILVDVEDFNCPTGNVSGTALVSDSILQVSVSLDVIPDCDSINGSLSALVTSGGVGPYDYTWSNGDVTNSADSISAGYNAVIVIDLGSTVGCKGEGVALVDNPTGPSIVIDGATPPSCFGASDASISTTISGVGPLNIQWTNGFSTDDIVNIIGGYHVVEVTDLNGCKALDSVFVPEPDPITNSFVFVEPACGVANGGIFSSPTGGSGSYTYSWSSGGTAASETGIGLGMYVVDILDGNGCTASDSMYLNEVGSPTVLFDSIIKEDCGNGNGAIYITASSTGTISYDWDGGNVVEDLVNTNAGAHMLLLSDGTCSSGHMMFLPSVRPEPTQICLATVDSNTNENVIVWEELAGNGISHYNVYRRALFGQEKYLKVGSVPFDSLSFFIDTVANTEAIWWNYKLQTVDSCGSESELSEVSNHKTIHLSIYPSPAPGEIKLKWNHYQGFTFTQYYIDRYTTAGGWVTIDSVSSAVTEFSTALPVDTVGLAYQIFAKAPANCSATKAIGDFNSSRSNRKSKITGVGPGGLIDNELSVLIYPNPTESLVHVQFMNVSNSEKIEVRDLLGKLLLKRELKGGQSTMIDLGKYDSGTYLFTITGKDYQVTKKVVMQ